MKVHFSAAKLAGYACGAALLIASTGLAVAQQADDGPPSKNLVTEGQQSVAAALAYWTEERMRNAVPALPEMQEFKLGQSTGSLLKSASTADGKPTLVPGWDPSSGLAQPEAGALIVSEEAQASGGVTTQAYGSPPLNPVDFGGYGKFQRFTMFGNYLVYPRSVLGKLFFSKAAGGNFVCSATVVNRSTIITAGHCVSAGGASTFHKNFVFCPSYYKGSGSGAAHPSRGCWSGVYVATSSNWYASGSIDRDYGCLSLATTGTVNATKIGNITGWAGMAYNYGSDEQVLATGYPAGAPFPGYHLITTMAAEWYTVNQFAGDTYLSKYIGNDMTGGSSGGGWLLNWEHKAARYGAAAGDSSNITDPFQHTSTPYVHGVNSHKRCRVSCGAATSASGTFIDEMGSPMFELNGGDANDVESVYNKCVANKGT